MRLWSDLLATALVGTDRRGEASDEAARALLDEAAAWTVYRRAGLRPIPGQGGAGDPAPAETRPLVGDAAAARLAVLADPDPFGSLDPGHRTALLAEWLRTATQRGRRLPPETLPDLFETARRIPELRPLIVAAAGARAAWLATLNPEWTPITSTVDESAAAWTDGTLGQRTGYLTTLRRSDPAAGRELLVKDWSTLDAGERTQLLGPIAIGLGPDDEPFLESTLDDRRREVRLLAAQLLSAITGSRYNARMTERARTAVTVDGGRIVVNPPDECDPDMRRDGIEPKPPTGTGTRAWWLQQILARTRLDTLTDLDPKAWLGLSIEDDWTAVICRGLAQAARAQRNPAWAAAVLDRVDPRARPSQADQDLIDQLYPVLPADELVHRAGLALQAERPDAVRLVGRMLEMSPGPWPDELATIALAAFVAHAESPKAPFDLNQAIRYAGLRMPPSYANAAAALAQRLDAERPDDRRVHLFERLADMLLFRYEMIQEIA